MTTAKKRVKTLKTEAVKPKTKKQRASSPIPEQLAKMSDEIRAKNPPRDKLGRITKGTMPPKGLQVHPENRSAGHWSKEHSISHQYHNFLKMTHTEFKQWQDKNPTSERTMAQDIAYQRVSEVLSGSVKTSEKMYGTDKIQDRTEGKAPIVAQVNYSKNEAIKDLNIDELRALSNLGKKR